MGTVNLWSNRSIANSTGPILLEEMTLPKFEVASEKTAATQNGQAPPELPEILIE